MSLDFQSFCHALKSNSSLKELCAPLFLPRDETGLELLEAVLKERNTTLTKVDMNTIHEMPTDVCKNIKYYTTLNASGRKSVQTSTLSYSCFERVLLNVMESHSTIDSDHLEPNPHLDKDNEDREERVIGYRAELKKKELGLLYGLLHESVGVWSMAHHLGWSS